MTSQKSPWREAVVYQVYPWTFNENEAREPQRGNGSILGIAERIPYFKELGIDAIWISPPFKSPMVDGGYDISDYRDIHPDLGTLQDLDELIRLTHEQGIRLMLDFVPNHTSDQHEWFQKSENRQEGFEDWYIWHSGIVDENGNRQPPNNWGSVFSIPNKKARERGEMPELGEDDITPLISAWRWNENRNEFYLASFAKEQPDLNWSNPMVRNAMFDTMRFWFDRGVDGLRVDVANHLGKNMQLTNEEMNTSYHEDVDENPYDQLDKHQSCGHPLEMHQYIWEMGQVLKEEQYRGRDLRLILEAYMGESELRDIDHIIPEVANSFNFVLMRLDWKAIDHKILTDVYYAGQHRDGVGNQVNGNHDNTRIASKLGDNRARAATVKNLFLPGMRFIYNGEELGLHDAVDIPVDRLQDPNGLRDPERTPMIFDDTKPNGGFSNADPAQLWLPLNQNDMHLSVERQRHDPKSQFTLTRLAIELCKALPAVQQGEYVPIDTNNDDVFAYKRIFENDEAIVMTNFSNEQQKVFIGEDNFVIGKAVLSSIDVQEAIRQVDLRSGVLLQPDEAIVVVAN